MTQEARYAIYLAPPPDTPLWRFGSRVLGYDAATGEDLEGFAPAGFDLAAWRAITARPRVYGFHATLKAPFRLAAGATAAELATAMEAFCAGRPAFDIGPLAVSALSEAGGRGFAALTEARPSRHLAELELDAVRAFDRFRAPPTEAETRKRRPESLTPRQRESLERFGYPHVGPDYRFHMTLSGEVADVADIADRLADAMANEIGTAHLAAEALVLFEQADPDQRFRIAARFELCGAPAAGERVTASRSAPA